MSSAMTSTSTASDLPPAPVQAPSSSRQSSPRKRLSKVFSAGRRRSSDTRSDRSVRSSLDVIGVGRSSTRSSNRSASRDRASLSSNDFKRTIIPGYAKRERKKIREGELAQLAAREEAVRGRQPSAGDAVRPQSSARSSSSLLTNDSDLELAPPLQSHDSHTGLLTTSSPLVTTTPIDLDSQPRPYVSHSANASMEEFPTIVEPSSTVIPTDYASSSHIPSSDFLNSQPVLVDKADTLKVDPPSRRSSISKLRGKSPARKFKDVFSRGNKSARTSPERPHISPGTSTTSLNLVNNSFGERRLSQRPEQRAPSPLRSQPISAGPGAVNSPRIEMPVLQTDLPRTPPSSAGRMATLVQVTPPTPTDPFNRENIGARKAAGSVDSPDVGTDPSEGSVASSLPSSPVNVGVLAHRRGQSTSSSLLGKSKLSNFMNAPLTPQAEEPAKITPGANSTATRNTSAGTGFFSNWMSTAQNATSALSNLTNIARSRAGTTAQPEADSARRTDDAAESAEQQADVPQDSIQRQPTVDTLGSGDLALHDLGIDAHKGPPLSIGIAQNKIRAESLSAKMEDVLAKRAVSQAYEPSTRFDATPVAELSDPVNNIRAMSMVSPTNGTLTPPGGSIFEGETGSVRRTTSVRSKLANRRSRGSSIVTTTGTIPALVGASTSTLANPATGPKLSGFAIAPKPRNRAFHQQFRSVPEDDFLIEDYSCAIQRDILLAGRIYISEGHICFSSNILGWITTVIVSFEEIVSIEKENTAIVIPNALVIQTLHQRHLFRSLLQRDATYDLMIGIWRVSHPESFKKSVNGKQESTADTAETKSINADSGENEASDEETESESGSDSDSLLSHGSQGSTVSVPAPEGKSMSPKPSLRAKNSDPAVSAVPVAGTGDQSASAAVPPATTELQTFPGPATHAPTECGDAAQHHDKMIKDEVIPAPLGKIYSLLFGPQSGVWLRKFLLDQKSQDLELEDDKTGLDDDHKTRQYKYIKPLGGSIGPKQTTCNTTERLEAFDLEKAVTVSSSTSTPDVPSGSAFTTKTKVCLTWAPGNATRLQMNMTIEWTARSFLKGPIESGALAGQQQYGEELVKALKSSLGRGRAPTAGSKAVKGKKKRKSSKKDKGEVSPSPSKQDPSWGAFELLRPTLGPVVAPVAPFLTMRVLVSILTIMVLWMWIRSPIASTKSSLSHSRALEHELLYQNLWHKEQHDLWDWLERRAGVDTLSYQNENRQTLSAEKERKDMTRQRKQMLKNGDVQARLREHKMSQKEMEEAIRVTQDRLESLKASLDRQSRQYT